MEIQSLPPRCKPQFGPDQGAIFCILGRGSSPQECGADDAKCVLRQLVVAENHRVGMEGTGDNDLLFFSGHIHRLEILI